MLLGRWLTWIPSVSILALKLWKLCGCHLSTNIETIETIETRGAPSELTAAPEEVEAKLLNFVAERLEEPKTQPVSAEKLRTLLAGRF
mmetsp:Transcript_44678/g.97088  ORF Transcript_44678/g.97088 Transcript_44678/m.97088 type:complete len:88 (+) Transcript_44678:2326-2589(+)